MRVVVTGSGGTVGSAMLNALAHAGLEPVLHTRTALDVTDRAAVDRAIRVARPLAVVHLAARTNVDRCEQDREDAYRVNVVGTEHVAMACRSVDSLLLYVSTGGVFGGWEQDGPYDELTVPRCANWYSTTKLGGESAAARATRWAVVRAGWVVGGGADDPKFVGKMLRQLEGGGIIRAVNDRLGTLTFADDLATTLACMARDQVEGTWHVTSPGVVSRYDIATELASILGREVSLQPVSHTAFPAPAPRGRSEALCTLRSGTALPEPEEWRARLRRYVTAIHDRASLA